MSVEDRVRVYHRQGLCLADLRVTAERNLHLREEGEAEFDIPITDSNCRLDFLQFGNWLLVENSKLEPWVGMIDTPYEWKKRYLHIHAYTPEHLFAKRNVPRQLQLSGSSGAIFEQLIHLINRAEPTILQAGEIWKGGKNFPAENISGDNLRDTLENLVERSNREYSFTPVAYNGHLTIYANWHKRLGIESPFSLEESWNLADEGNSIRVQGTIENELWGYGNGAGQTDRPTATYKDDESIGDYGLMQGSVVYSDYDDEGAVLGAIKEEINTTRRPVNTYKLSMLDEGATYSNVRIGNIHPLRTWSVGFGVKTKTRVVGWYYNPPRGKVDLNNEEVLDDISG